MASGPTLFDDGDGSDDPDRRDAASTEGGGVDDGPGRPRSSRRTTTRPNYLFRRAVVVGGVVAVLATASIVVGNLIGSGADTSQSGAVDVDWNRIVLIDERDGDVVVHDEAGDEVERVDTGVRGDAGAVAGRVALVLGEASIAAVDLDSTEIERVEFGADRLVAPAGSARTLIASGIDGERGLLVHGPSGDRVDTVEFVPLAGTRYEFAEARATPSGRDVLVTDSGNFQSVLFSFDGDEPSFFPGLALALDDDVVVTAQNVGADATVTVSGHDGEPVSSGRTASVRAGLVADGRIQLVTVDGLVVEMSPADGATDDGEQLEIGTVESGRAWSSGDRLIVTGTDGTAIVAATGEVLAELPGDVPDATTFDRQRCLTVTADTGRLRLVDVSTGEIVAETDRSGTVHASADGCTVVITSADTTELLTADRAAAIDVDGLDVDGVVALAPDASALVVERDRRAVLVPIDVTADPVVAQGALDDGADLGPAGRTPSFTQL